MFPEVSSRELKMLLDLVAGTAEVIAVVVASCQLAVLPIAELPVRLEVDSALKKKVVEEELRMTEGLERTVVVFEAVAPLIM